MLSDVHLEVRPCVVFLVAPRELTMELVHVLVCAFVVPQDPFLPEDGVTAWELAGIFLILILLMCCQMICEMLRHFEAFSTIRIAAFIESH